MDEKSIEYRESKVLVMAEKLVDARLVKAGPQRVHENNLADAVIKLRKKRAEIAAEAAAKPP